MFDIKITAIEEVQGLLDADWPTRIISLVKQEMPDLGRHHLQVQFDDISRPVADYIHPEMHHILEVLEFTKDLVDDDKVLVHCRAGISRSTAMAIGIFVQHGMDYIDAYNQIELSRPMLSPNLLMIHYIDTHFGLNGDLYALMKANEKYPHLFHRIMAEDNPTMVS